MSELAHVVECERSLLGAILIDGLRVMDLCLEAGLCQDAFASEQNKLVYRACVWLAKQRKPIDLSLVIDVLRKHNCLDSVDNGKYLEDLIDATPTALHAEHYLDEVKNAWLLRQIADESKQALDEIKHCTRDPKDILSERIQKLTALGGGRERGQRTKSEVWKKVHASAVAAREGVPMGVPAPWPNFTKYTGGAKFGLVSLVVGRAKTRKSYVVNQWGIYAGVSCPNPMPGAYYPLEDGQDVAMGRASCTLAGVDCWRFEHGRFNDEEDELITRAARKIIDSPYEIREGRGLSMAQMRLDIARGVAKHGWRFVIIDAFKDMDTSGGAYQEEGKISKWSQDVSREFDIALIMVHHVRKNRGEGQTKDDKEQERLRIEDVRGNSRIADDARMVIALQCKIDRTEGRVRYVDYVLDCLANNYGQTASICLDLDEETGLFEENASRVPWIDEHESEYSRYIKEM